MMTVETGLDVCVNKMAGTINKTMKNKILSLHAAWLFKNGYYDFKNKKFYDTYNPDIVFMWRLNYDYE